MIRGRLPEALVAGVCGVYLLVLALEFGSIVTAMNWIADSSSGFVIAGTLSDAGEHGRTVMATSGQYVSLWFGRLTSWVPAHRQLWEAAPYAVHLVTCGIIIATVRRIAGARAAWLSAAVLIPAAPLVLWYAVRAVSHTPAYLGTAVLGAFLVWLWHTDPRRTPHTVAIAAGTAAVTGVFMASDPLLVVTGIVPFAVALAAGGSRTRALWAGATLAGAGLAALATSALMRRSVLTASPDPAFADPATWPDKLVWLGKGLLRLGHGRGAGVNPAERPLAYLLGACVVVLAVVVVVVTIVWTLRRGDPLRRVHVAYWTTSAVLVCSAFFFSTQGFNGGDQYILTTVFSIAAIVPLELGRRALAAALIVACVPAVTSTIAVAGGDVQRIVALEISRQGVTLLEAARREGVTRGYAGYWNASSLTWSSRDEVQVRPVAACAQGLCPFFLMRVPSWYEPSGGRSFLIVDPTTAEVPAIPPGLGDPIATHRAGPMTLLVYPYDIANRLGPAPN